jgi:hypothetical protein
MQWQSVQSSLEECLTFLTGDHWQISFSKIELDVVFFPRKNRWKSKIPLYDKSKYQYVSLFSGGLDSLIGAVDLLEQLKQSKKILLVSHFDSNSVGPKKDQETLKTYLSSKYPKRVERIFSTISVNIPEKLKKKVTKDSNYRSRSFLFVSIANYLINSIPKVNQLIIPENGTISLNHPLTPSRSSSLSTRTTHPYFISKLNQIFSQLEIDDSVINPYSFKTKGEMIIECKNTNLLSSIYEKSVSCAKRGRFRIHKKIIGTNHCGICMPCIYRRAALNKLGWDEQLYGTDILSLNGKNGFEDQSAFSDYLKTNLSKEQIMRNLLVNGSLPLDILNQYAELILRSRDELKKWVSQKGNSYIKKMIGLQ